MRKRVRESQRGRERERKRERGGGFLRKERKKKAANLYP